MAPLHGLGLVGLLHHLGVLAVWVFHIRRATEVTKRSHRLGGPAADFHRKLVVAGGARWLDLQMLALEGLAALR
eukprot:12429544-Alexandrium_andersonii.AAC.1